MKKFWFNTRTHFILDVHGLSKLNYRNLCSTALVLIILFSAPCYSQEISQPADHLLLVSSSVKDSKILAEAANNDTAVIRYDAETTSLDDLLDLIRSFVPEEKLSSLGLITHDYGANKFYLTGKHTISIGSLINSQQQQQFWKQLGRFLTDDGRIDLFTCNLARGAQGSFLISRLEQISGVAVAASTNETGNNAAGADWILETDSVDIAELYFNHEKLQEFKGILVTENKKLIASDGSTDEHYGISVSISGDYLVVSKPLSTGSGIAPPTVTAAKEVTYLYTKSRLLERRQNSGSRSIAVSLSSGGPGAVYIYSRNLGGSNNWGEVKKLVPSDLQNDSLFGTDVAIDGDTIVVGAPDYLNGTDITGAAYVFERNHGGTDNWGEVKRLIASDAEDNDTLGLSVAIEGNTIIAGNPFNDDVGMDSGTAHIFCRNEGGENNWGEVKILRAFDAASDDYFGFSVGISGDNAVVGSPFDIDNSFLFGSAYLLNRNQGGSDNWGHVAKLSPSNGQDEGEFGSSVSISGDYVVVGSPQHIGTSHLGSAYIYYRNQGGNSAWGEVAVLLPTDASTLMFFGAAVFIDGELAIIGSSSDDNLFGSAFVFRRTSGTGTWTQVEKLFQLDRGEKDAFGVSVSKSGNTYLVGAPFDDDNGLESGSAYIFELLPPTIINQTATNITTTDATLGGTVTSDNGYTVTERGVVWSTSADPDINNNMGSFTTSGALGTFSASATALAPGTTYHYRAYASNAIGTGYTSDATFRTLGIFSITVSSVVGGTTDKDGVNLVIEGGSLTITADANALYDFNSWSGDATGNANPLTLTNITSNMTITPVFTRHTGRLYTILQGAGSEGGWCLAGQIDWRPTGNTARGIPTGNVWVEFKPVEGYHHPDPVLVKIAKDSLTELIALYTNKPGPTGSVSINLSNDQVPAGAQWRIVSSGGPAPAADDVWFDFGTTVTGIPVGEVEIEFSVIPGCILPAHQKFDVQPGNLHERKATYLQPFFAHTFDYDGNGRDDLPVYDQATNTWSVASFSRQNSAPSVKTIIEQKFGTGESIPAPGDYDGDSITDLAYFDAKNSIWRIRSQFRIEQFGQEKDIPVPGDYLGRGYTQPALFRPTSGEWFIYDQASDNVITITFGEAGDIPVPGNWDGDSLGTTDPGVYDVNSGLWRMAIYNQRKDRWIPANKLKTTFGIPGDIPVQADYDGDGTTDIAVYRPSGFWLVKDQFESMFGIMDDIPIPNDWNGDGKAEPAIFRLRSGRWLSFDSILKANHGKGKKPLISGK